MCGRAFSEYDVHRHTSEEPRRSLFAWLRELWQPRQAPEAEVVPFAAASASRTDQVIDRNKDARAA
jgi:hypothetical protein